MNHLPADKEARRQALYIAGATDAAIAAAENVAQQTIHSWRRARGLPAHHPVGDNTLSAEDDGLRMDMWSAGYTDAEIARECGRRAGVIWSWRQQRGLAPNARPGEQANRRKGKPKGR